MPDITPGAVVELTQFATYQGQTIMNVFHYEWTNANSGDYNVELLSLLDRFKINVWNGGLTPWKGLLVEDFVVQRWRAQRVAPSREYYLEKLADATDKGGIVAVGIPSDVNITVSLRGFSTVRGTTGNKKLTGLPIATLDGNLFTAGTVNTFQDMSDGFKTVLNDAGLVPSWTPIVWSPVRPLDRRQVIATTARPQVRVLRKREYAKGV